MPKLTNQPREVAKLREDCAELKRVLARAENTRPPVFDAKMVRRLEWLAFEKCRELVERGADPASVANPYTTGADNGASTKTAKGRV